MSFISIHNHQSVPVSLVPVVEYNLFLDQNIAFMESKPERHCVIYFGYRLRNRIRLICCIADDTDHSIRVSSAALSESALVDSFSAKNISFERFEREIHENFGIRYTDHPWLKPLRYSEERADRSQTISYLSVF